VIGNARRLGGDERELPFQRNAMKTGPDPEIRFLYASLGEVRPFDETTLDTQIPLSRPTGEEASPSVLTYRQYLHGVRRFLLDNWKRVIATVSEICSTDFPAIDRIDIVVEKHGSDYHPARIEVHAVDCGPSFVANVAVTDRGRSRLSQDFQFLRLLRDRYDRDFVPAAYFMGEAAVNGREASAERLTMFLGEWLAGYHEFHLSDAGPGVPPATVLWDLSTGYTVLTEQEAADVYRQAAFILSYYYDPVAFSEIYPWHHASGDFVASRADGRIRVKLVTVREYGPRILFEEESPENALEALLVFFAHLTIRMRLDRFDGVGEVAWADDHCVEATVQGFLEALKEKVDTGACDPALPTELLRVARCLSPRELVEVFSPALEAYHENSPDMPVISEHLADHIFRVYQTLQQLPPALEFG